MYSLDNTVHPAPFLIAGLALLCGCGHSGTPRKPEITVAAAANLTDSFGEIATRFEAATGAHVIHSFAATGDLTRQIENAAPFDVFAAADVGHVDELVARGRITEGTRAVYARGQLALWTPPGGTAQVNSLADLDKPAVRFIAIAKPEVAPYGAAAVESLRNSHVWESVQPKVVYAESISMSKQYAATHNADASFTAYSLVLNSGGHVLLVDEKLHKPIQQAMAVVKRSPRQDLARRYEQFVLGTEGRAILERYGYGLP